MSGVFMISEQFKLDFSQNFIDQVQRVLDVDGFLLYSINDVNEACDYQAFNISKSSVEEYVGEKLEEDPVSFSRFYYEKDHHVALLNEHELSSEYSEFMHRWKVIDSAEIFFRNRMGLPVLGLSILRSDSKQLFSDHDKNILNSFCHLSKHYFYQNSDRVEKDYLSARYQLTKKEIMVFELLLNGLNNTSISMQLNCSLATVKTHIQHLYQKLQVKNRQEAICKFLR